MARLLTWRDVGVGFKEAILSGTCWSWACFLGLPYLGLTCFAVVVQGLYRRVQRGMSCRFNVAATTSYAWPAKIRLIAPGSPNRPSANATGTILSL